MERRALLNLALLAAVVAVGALYWHDARAPADAGVVKAFPGVAAATRLRFDPGAAAGRGFALEKRGDAWWVVAPFTAAADPRAVADLLDQLAAAAQHGVYPLAELDPAAVGLAAPGATLAYDAGGGEARFAFGGTEPLNYRRYVERDGQVQLVDDLVSYRLQQGAAPLVGTRLLPPAAAIARLELPGATLARAADGRWTLTPDDPRIPADALVALVERWRQASAVAVRQPATPDAAPALGTVRVVLDGVATPLEFTVLRSLDGLRLARRDLGLEYDLPEAARAELLELAPPAGR